VVLCSEQQHRLVKSIGVFVTGSPAGADTKRSGTKSADRDEVNFPCRCLHSQGGEGIPNGQRKVPGKQDSKGPVCSNTTWRGMGEKG